MIKLVNPNNVNKYSSNFHSDPPTFNILLQFMESQIGMLESIEKNNSVNKTNQNINLNSNNNKFKNSNITTQPQVKVFHTQLNSIKVMTIIANLNV